MESKKKILYIGNFSFPYGNASGIRVLGNGLLFREMGYEVIYIGLDYNLTRASSLKDTENWYDGFRYYSFPYPVGVRGWFSYKDRFEEVIKLLKGENLHLVITYGSPSISLFNTLLKKWSKINNIIYLADCVDWLSSSSGSIIHRTIKFLDDNYQKRVLNAQADGVIAISSYLSDYYKDRGKKTIIIPPLVNSSRYEDLGNAFYNKNKPIQLIYVGVPFPIDGRKVKLASYKDRLDVAIEALSELTHYDFNFNIYGLTQEQYLSVVSHHTDTLISLGDKVQFQGKINNSEAIVKISESDFTILLRDVNRMTSAGFPTKFVESITCGTPVITTDTSDLKEYLEINKSGFFVSIENRRKLHIQLSEILSLDRTRIRQMKQYCKDSQLFSYRKFVEEMGSFMKFL